MTTLELAREYNEAKKVVYGLSVQDFLLLREQSLKEGEVLTTERPAENIPTAATTRSVNTAPNPKRAENPAPVEKPTERRAAVTTPPVTHTDSPASALDILRGLGE